DLPARCHQICDPSRPVTFVPMLGDRRRWEYMLIPGETAADLEDPVAMWHLLAPWVGPEDFEVIRAIVYSFHALVATRWRSGRILLAGDAAHQMPPFLGQGLCAGLRDVANLTWKLQAVADGRAGDGLLDTYDLERRPHAAAVVAHAVEAGRLIDQLAGRIDAQADPSAGYGGDRPFPHLVDGVCWGDDPMVGRQLPQPWPGADEALGDGWAVLTRSGSAVGGLGARAVASGLAGPAGGIVVRPDRYVAAVAETDEELERALADLGRWFEASEQAVGA
ncbi:MAG TPA: FAD-dependent monooxygenase, partial [Acidimicrobiales bacterium]|nr:FAD-dependent monooxygenase [Acidimicrobiales bacterium]